MSVGTSITKRNQKLFAYLKIRTDRISSYANENISSTFPWKKPTKEN